MYCPKKDWSKSSFFEKIIRCVPQSYASNVARWFNVYPLDTSQYKNMFCSTRLPGNDCDQLVNFSRSHHLLVIHNGHYYYFDVLDDCGEIIPANLLLSNLQFILKQLKLTNPPPPSIGVITAMSRDKAFMARQRLIDLGNQVSLNLIDSALFVLALTDETAVNHVNAVGFAINFEHSWGDGVTISRLFTDVYINSEKHPVVDPSMLKNTDSLPNPTVKRIEWILDDDFVLNIIQPNESLYNAWRDKLIFSCVDKRDSINRRLYLNSEVKQMNNYPPEFIQNCMKTKRKNKSSSENDENSINNMKSKASIVLLYQEGTSDVLGRILNKTSIRMAFKLINSLRVATDPVEKNNIIYRIACNDSKCGELHSL
ncbi:unnamed protein product [Trichobilharzia regenti]|nr:unnamed protein product [Trichobilharzia regenti]